jgi:hypothetical protein
MHYFIPDYLSENYKTQKNIESFASSKENIDLNWITWIIYATIAASVTTAFYNVFSGERSLNIYISIFFMLVVYIVAFIHSTKRNLSKRIRRRGY